MMRALLWLLAGVVLYGLSRAVAAMGQTPAAETGVTTDSLGHLAVAVVLLIAALGCALRAMAHGWDSIGRRSGRETSTPERQPVADDEGDAFDPDAALSNYLTRTTPPAPRKAEQAPPRAGLPSRGQTRPPVRPTGFGRRGL